MDMMSADGAGASPTSGAPTSTRDGRSRGSRSDRCGSATALARAKGATANMRLVLEWLGSPATRFYAWASVIQDGRVVATDYAPDTGWLETTVKPGPTDQPGESPAP